MKKALVCGAGGFIGSHLVRRLKKEGYFVRGVDLKYPEFSKTEAEIAEIKKKIGPESELGDRTSKQTAAVISGLIMVLIITIMIVT